MEVDTTCYWVQAGKNFSGIWIHKLWRLCLHMDNHFRRDWHVCLCLIVVSDVTHEALRQQLRLVTSIEYSVEFIYIVGQIAVSYINLLKPTGHVMHQQVQHSTTVRSDHTVFMCSVFIWEQTATCATYSINWLVFITETKSVYCAVRTGSLNTAVCISSLSS